MLSDPLVSIILPTYNRADLLPGAIESVLAQTYPAWELLVWDDGSTDRTGDVVRAYQDDRIRYFYADNHGKSYALNQALQRVRGDMIAFLDDDDRWAPDKLEIQRSILTQNPGVDLVLGNFININQVAGSEGLSFTQNAKGFKALQTQCTGEAAFIITGGWLQGIARANFIAFDTVILCKKAVEHLGPFNESLKNGMDFEYWWRFGLAGLTAAYTETVVMTRIKVLGSLSGSNLASIENHLKMLDACAKLSIEKSRPETIAYLRPMYRNAWQNKIVVYAKEGNKKKAWGAFLQSLKYGFRLGSAKLLFHALIKAPVAAARGAS